MKLALRNVVGAFAFLQRRSREVGQPGLTVYAEAGTQAVQQVGGEIRDLAHRNEVTEQTLADRLKAITADGRVDPAELRELVADAATLERCAGRSHDITEAAGL